MGGACGLRIQGAGTKRTRRGPDRAKVGAVTLPAPRPPPASGTGRELSGGPPGTARGVSPPLHGTGCDAQSPCRRPRSRRGLGWSRPRPRRWVGRSGRTSSAALRERSAVFRPQSVADVALLARGVAGAAPFGVAEHPPVRVLYGPVRLGPGGCTVCHVISSSGWCPHPRAVPSVAGVIRVQPYCGMPRHGDACCGRAARCGMARSES